VDGRTVLVAKLEWIAELTAQVEMDFQYSGRTAAAELFETGIPSALVIQSITILFRFSSSRADLKRSPRASTAVSTVDQLLLNSIRVLIGSKLSLYSVRAVSMFKTKMGYSRRFVDSSSLPVAFPSPKISESDLFKDRFLKCVGY